MKEEQSNIRTKWLFLAEKTRGHVPCFLCANKRYILSLRLLKSNDCYDIYIYTYTLSSAFCISYMHMFSIPK